MSGKEFSNDPVFYGPDGEILTDEESAFLWNATSYTGDGCYEDEEELVLIHSIYAIKQSSNPIIFLRLFPPNSNEPDALVDIEPEMDLEIQLAFKDFVTLQNNK